jgi:hypothetical protein
MGSITIPAWCQFLALTSFTFRSKVIRYALLAGLLLIISSAWLTAHYGSPSNQDVFVLMGGLGVALMCLPVMKAVDIKLRLGLLGVLPEFMAMLFAEQPFPKWLASKFGKPDSGSI